MSWSHTFIELDKSVHDRDSFDCGESELNNFIKTHAAKHMASGISRTLLLPATNALPDGKIPICAFYTIAASCISRESLPKGLAKKLPHYPVPVFILAQIAVHRSYQSRGLGKITLIAALRHFVEIDAHMRAYAIVVDCLNEEAQSFYRKYGFELLCVSHHRTRMFLPMKIVKQLFLSDQ